MNFCWSIIHQTTCSKHSKKSIKKSCMEEKAIELFHWEWQGFVVFYFPLLAHSIS